MFQATYWADKAIDEQVQAIPEKPALKSSKSGQSKLGEPRSEIEATKKLMTENVEKLLERGERLDVLTTKTDDLAVSAKAFRTQVKAQKSTWYDLLSAPVIWVGDNLGALGSRLWEGPSEPVPDTPVLETITFVHEVEEDLSARKRLLAAAIGEKIGILPGHQVQQFAGLREQMKDPEYTIDECTKHQVHLFKAMYDDCEGATSDKVPLAHLGDMVRRLGHSPDDRVLDTWCLEAGLKAGDTVTFESTLTLLESILPPISYLEKRVC